MFRNRLSCQIQLGIRFSELIVGGCESEKSEYSACLGRNGIPMNPECRFSWRNRKNMWNRCCFETAKARRDSLRLSFGYESKARREKWVKNGNPMRL